MNPYNEYLIHQQHLKDIARAAEHERLVRLALEGNKESYRSRVPFLAWLWQQLGALRCFLQDLFKALPGRSTETRVFKPCFEQEDAERS